MSIDVMKLALEYLEASDNYLGSLDHSKPITALRTAIEQAEKQEPVAWKNAAIRLGEELSSVGPDGYYDMTADQWLDWAMDQRPRGKNSLPAAPAQEECVVCGDKVRVIPRPWVGLTDEEIKHAPHHVVDGAYHYSFKQGAEWADRWLREKNGGQE